MSLAASDWVDGRAGERRRGGREEVELNNVSSLPGPLPHSSQPSAKMKFLPIAPLSRLLSHTRHSLLFHLHPVSHPSHKSHRLLLFRLASPSPLSKPEFYSMEAQCPHLGADLDAADVEDGIITCPWHQYDVSPIRPSLWTELTRASSPRSILRHASSTSQQVSTDKSLSKQEII